MKYLILAVTLLLSYNTRADDYISADCKEVGDIQMLDEEGKVVKRSKIFECTSGKKYREQEIISM